MNYILLMIELLYTFCEVGAALLTLILLMWNIG